MCRTSFRLSLALALLLATSCSVPPSTPEATSEARQAPLPLTAPEPTPLHPERRGIGLLPPAAPMRAATVTVDTRRSLVVTEQAIVSTLTFKEVMDQLAAQSGVPGLTGLGLFRQFWDTQNPKPGQGPGAHCDDQVDANGNPLFNGYPYQCRPGEGAQAQADPFTNPQSNDAYITTGFFNRFDTAPADGSDCGEYRIVFAKRSGASNPLNRNHIIFEAVLPNPRPELGLEGCLPVARFWQGLSTNDDLASRAAALKQFYLQGLPGFPPVVHINHYGADTTRPSGQIRTNMFMQQNWMLREFRLQKTCGPSSCTALQTVIVTDKVNPFGGLFNPASTHPLAADFRAFLPGQVELLANPDINVFSYGMPDRFNTAQSDAEGPENDYSLQFGTGGTLKQALQAELTRIGSPLTPEHIVQRAKVLSCAGCHQFSNNANIGAAQPWPASLGFVHISESTENGPEGVRYRLSPALVTVLLPHRKAVFEAFLNLPRSVPTSAVSAGYSHSLALHADGTVWASGYNLLGQLGDGTTATRSTPAPVQGLAGATAISAGTNHSLALRADGTVWAWGDNANGQLGDGTTTNRSLPVQVQGLTGVIAVDAGGVFSVALRSDGTVWAWGSNASGQLGDGTATRRTTPVQVLGLSAITSVTAGASHALAVRSDGTLWAWGNNEAGKLGDGTTTARVTPVRVASMSGVTAVSAGNTHTLVLRSDGTVWQSGSRFVEQTPGGGWSSTPDLLPKQVPGLVGAVAVSAGASHSLVLLTDGTLWGWGLNTEGPLGTGARIGAATPAQVASEGAFVSMSAGGSHSLAIRSDGTLWAWGSNADGQRGDGTRNGRKAPAVVPGLGQVTAVTAGAFHALARKTDGSVWAWGDGSVGQLGLGIAVRRATPSRIPGLAPAKAVAAGLYHSLALLQDGTIQAWGYNASGQLGNGTTTQRVAPVGVSLLTGVVAVAAGESHSVAVRQDGTVWTWGANDQGQLGTGFPGPSRVPVQVPGLSNIVAVSSGANHCLALRSDGSLWAWGSNQGGRLGDGTTETRATPVRVPGLNDVVAMAAGGSHSLAVRADRTLWSWGTNASGELGLGDTTARLVPTWVSAVSDVVAVAAGQALSNAVRADGSAWNWGINGFGAWWPANTYGSRTPQRTATPGVIQSVATGTASRGTDGFGLAVRDDGTVWSWGFNSDGQLGTTEPTIIATTPVRSSLL
jgi:alpha-tubulin suppressor-like RCC1 family protein